MSPRTHRQWEEIRGKSRLIILHSALQLFAEKGFNATSMNDIAKKGNISKGLVYNYYKSKFHLLDAIIDEAFTEIDSLFDHIKKINKDPIETLCELLKVTFDSLEEKPEFWKLITGLSFKNQIKARYEEKINQRKIKYFEIGSYLISQLKVENPIEELLFIGAIIDGIAFHYIEEPDIYPKEMMLKVFRNKMIKLYK